MNTHSGQGRLSGITAIWTGSPDGAQELIGALIDQGATVERLPLIELKSTVQKADLVAALDELDDEEWLVFTSREAARVVTNLSRPRASLHVAAVGPATASVLRSNGWGVDLVPENHHAAGLARELIATVDQRPSVLFFRGDHAQPTLPRLLEKAAFRVRELEVYHTIPVSPARAAQIAEQIRDRADLVIAGSPLGVRTLSDACAGQPLEQLNERLSWVCLGPTTERALLAAGAKRIACPEMITPSDFVEAVLSILAKR